ncbi:efflux transporter outer membrane subunit [Gluconacetobacter tumulisoli]|uniref:Efflux transporter outer membrane subunit n=1 Tax=Gluconacetobacter tumulisoli TaxID=1286189 RepID=A0A7W4K635_9PROT|nr:efflux transporter outer membrane subunit [Gluconacetobacter tumulisoli]MBB2201072.1 efflux transporter outer membrane subunit [Gluconacetobacter tumulisoli]
MMASSVRTWPMLLCGVLAIGGCAVGPDFRRPAIPAPTQYGQAGQPSATPASAGADGAAQLFRPGQDIPAQWWTLFHSPALDRLVRHALAHSPTLEAARDALRAAQENRLAQESPLYPSISASYNPARFKTSRTYSPVPGNNTYLYTVHTAQLSISYMPDIWGGVRRGVEAASAQRDAQRYQLEAAYLTLTSSVVQAAIDYAAVKAQIDTTQALIVSQQAVLSSSIRQQALGQLADADVAAQRALLAQDQATLPPLQQQLAQQHDLIAALAGDMPDDPTPEFTLDGFTLPRDLPVSLPARLIEQRPDIRVSEANWHTACAQVGVAVANRLPNIQLGATPGVAAASIAQMAVPGYGQWMIAGTLTQPLFDGGLLRHQEHAARAQYDAAAAQYRATVVSAVQDVADSLNAIRTDATALAANADAEDAAARSLAVARSRFTLGDASQVMMLTAQQTEFQARLAVVQARSARLSDTVGLFQALGGGWWNRTDDHAPPSKG